MPTPLAIAILVVAAIHAALGVVFAAWFLARGAARLDPAAARGPLGFRLIIAPGVVALWPLLLARCRRRPGPREPAP